MFGVGWTEMLLIGVVALIVIGPKDLPVVMRQIGKVVGTVRRMGGEFQRELNRTTGLDQITDLRRSITEPLKQTASEIRSEFNKMASDGSTVPSGAIAPKTPGAESVVAEIHEKAGMTPVAPATLAAPVMTGPKVESPAPAEAIAPVEMAKPVRKPRAKKAEPAAVPEEVKPTPKPRTRKAAAAAVAPAPMEATPAPAEAAPPVTRKRRTPKPKTEA
jgi:sec-independent protein translocase protein TatB